MRAPWRVRRAFPVIAALLAGSSGLTGGPLAAQQAVEGSAGAPGSAPAGDYDHARAPRVRAAPLRGSISIDGTLDESGWVDAPPITAFTQTLPLEGAPASEETEVRILYDGDAVYVGARLHDRSPATTRARPA